MTKTLTAEEIAKTNPRVDTDEVRKIEDLLEELRKQGVSKSEYDLVSPYERRPLHGPENPRRRMTP